jgi:putative ABC transport system permease protein
MENLLQDLRHSLRLLARNPGFALIAVGALGLGIGANTAIFSVVNAVLLAPLPYPDPERLVFLERQYPGGTSDSTSIPKFMVWKDNTVLEAVSAYDFAGPGMNLAGGDVPEQVKGIHASIDYFRLFGASPLLGRTFSPDEDRPGGARVVVLAYGLWQRRFGGDPGIIGRAINIGGDLHTVVGVLGRDFQPDPPAEVWLPLQADPASTNQGHYLRVAGRLRPGVTLAGAAAEMKVVGERFRGQYPQWMGPREGVAVLPMRQKITGDVRRPLLILVGAVSFVLLIACANVANLLLARAVGRRTEVAIRSALGAGRGRLIRQLLTESVLLASLGAALGVALASWGVRLLLRFSPGDIPRVAHIAAAGPVLDGRVLAFTLALTLVTGILFGLAPALEHSNTDVTATLKQAGSRGGAGRRSQHARRILVVAEIVLALVLVIGAGLLVRTFIGLHRVATGFDPHNVIAMEMSLAGARYSSSAQVERLVKRVVERVEGLPGVVAASVAITLPTQPIGIDLPFSIEGRPAADGSPYNGDEFWRYIGSDYFKVFAIPLRRGRFFTESDGHGAPPALIVNEAFVRKFFPQEEAIGRRIVIGKGLGKEFDDPPRQIVGIVGDVREGGLRQDISPVMYVPVGQVPDGMMRLGNAILPTNWVVRTAGPGAGAAIGAAIQREFLAVDSGLPVTKIRTMERVVSEGMARENFNTLLIGMFAAMALVLAAVGIYGVMSYVVEQRTREIGIRMALGAGRRQTLAMVVGQAMRMVAAGIVLGLGAAFGLTRLMSTLLFGVKPTDPLTFVVVPLFLALVALAATWIPARRATKVDPVVALRYE